MGTTIRPPHPLGSGFAMAWERDVHIDDPGLEVVLDLRLEVDDGRLVVERLEASRRPGGPPISVDLLKSLPLVGLVARASTSGLLSGLVRVRSAGSGHRVAPASLDDVLELPEGERVALIYRAALFFGMPPTAAVAETLEISRDAAAKRVQAARREGLLERTNKGQKGG